jgi:hypothetical protein
MDQPLPSPRFVKTSPYYNPDLAPQVTSPEILQTGQFCQSGQAFQTVDLKLDEGASIVSVNGDGKTGCQLVNENRVVCYGAPNASLEAQVGFQRDGAQYLRCPIGTDFDGDGCVFPSVPGGASPAGMDDWEYDANGVLVPAAWADQPPGVQPAEPEDQAVVSRQLPGGGLAGPILQGQVVINGVMVARDSYTPADAPATDCPAGYYLDTGANACLSLGPPQAQCLGGYHFNAEKLGCEADQPGGNYPGCPLGQLLDTSTGQCAANSQVLSLTSVMLVQPLQLNLPGCSSPGGGSGPDTGGGGAPSCPPGYTYTCDPVCGCAPP